VVVSLDRILGRSETVSGITDRPRLCAFEPEGDEVVFIDGWRLDQGEVGRCTDFLEN